MKPGLHEEVKVVSVIPPETFTAAETTYNNCTQAGASGIDLQGYDEAMCVAHLGAMTGTLDIDLFESDTDDAIAATQITDSNSVEADFDQLDGSEDSIVKVIRIRAKDCKRYLFVKVTNADTGSKTFGVTVLLSGADSRPVSQEQDIDFDHSDA